MTERPTSQCLHEGDDLGRFETDVCHGCGEHVPPGPSVQVVLTMSAEDAQTFLEDWETDHSAPVLTGGYQEHPVTVQAASLTGGLVANPQTAAGYSDQTSQSDVCSNCGGTGWDQTWHEGAPCAESHACDYCRGGTYSGRPLLHEGADCDSGRNGEGQLPDAALPVPRAQPSGPVAPLGERPRGREGRAGQRPGHLGRSRDSASVSTGALTDASDQQGQS